MPIKIKAPQGSYTDPRVFTFIFKNCHQGFYKNMKDIIIEKLSI